MNRRLPLGNYKHNHVEYSPKRNSYNEHHDMNRNNNYKSGEWRCYRCQQENQASRQRCFKCRLPREVQPVSYTHLDVYKRQVQCITNCRNGPTNLHSVQYSAFEQFVFLTRFRESIMFESQGCPVSANTLHVEVECRFTLVGIQYFLLVCHKLKLCNQQQMIKNFEQESLISLYFQEIYIINIIVLVKVIITVILLIILLQYN